MRIGVDAISFQPQFRAGVGVYLFNLLRHFGRGADPNEYVVYLNAFRQGVLDGMRAQLSRAGEARLDFRTTRMPSRLPERVRNAMWYDWILPREARRSGLDVLFCPNYYAPTRARLKVVITVHDVAPILHPQFAHARHLAKFAVDVPRMARMADAVLVPTSCTRSDVVGLGVDSHKVFVVYEASSEEFRVIEDRDRIDAVIEKHGLSSPFILFVSTLQPRKNVAGLIQAFLSLRARRSLPHKLVLVGQAGWKCGDVLRALAAPEAQGQVVWLRYVDEADLVALYNGAELLAFPSFCEGFGLPLLEAMKCGTPIVTSNCSSMPEVVGKAGILADPHSPEALAEAMEAVITNGGLRQRLRQLGLARAKEFSWEKTAKKTLNVIENVVGESLGC